MRSSKKPGWFRIANDYPDFGSGPTIPFLLGAIRIARSEEPAAVGKPELRELLEAMWNEMPEDHCGVIRQCGIIGRHIIELSPLVRAWVPARKPLDWRDFSRPIHDLDDLAEALWSLYGTFISAGHFSWDNDRKAWRAFDDDERRKIRETLAD